MFSLKVVYILVLICTSLIIPCSSLNAESRLYSYLMTHLGYNPHVRPVYEPSDVIQVYLSLVVLNLADFNDVHATATFNGFLKIEWSDAFLRWDPANFSGVGEMRLPREHVWSPDLVITSLADRELQLKHDPLVVVHHNGSIKVSLFTTATVYCDMNFDDYPNDCHICRLIVEPWTYDTRYVHVNIRNHWANAVNMLTPTRGWIINQFSHYPNLAKLSANEKWSQVVFQYTVKRHSPMSNFVLGVPILTLAVIQPALFFVHPEGSRRLLMSLLLLMSSFLIFLIQSSDVPRYIVVSSYPITFLTIIWILNTFQAVWFILSDHMWPQKVQEHAIPRILQPLVRSNCLLSKKRSGVVSTNAETARAAQSISMTQLVSADDLEEELRPTEPEISPQTPTQLNRRKKESPAEFTDWQRVCLSLDRIFFVLFSITYAMSIVFLFAKR